MQTTWGEKFDFSSINVEIEAHPSSLDTAVPRGTASHHGHCNNMFSRFMGSWTSLQLVFQVSAPRPRKPGSLPGKPCRVSPWAEALPAVPWMLQPHRHCYCPTCNVLSPCACGQKLSFTWTCSLTMSIVFSRHLTIDPLSHEFWSGFCLIDELWLLKNLVIQINVSCVEAHRHTQFVDRPISKQAIIYLLSTSSITSC